ncbi:hypothetical protein ASE49_05565 [Novosphingobium sp. Leaf2]|nr:hypothetical protein ASE49_05565 [Novosphingobium sp. Leaf2]
MSGRTYWLTLSALRAKGLPFRAEVYSIKKGFVLRAPVENRTKELVLPITPLSKIATELAIFDRAMDGYTIAAH